MFKLKDLCSELLFDERLDRLDYILIFEERVFDRLIIIFDLVDNVDIDRGIYVVLGDTIDFNIEVGKSKRLVGNILKEGDYYIESLGNHSCRLSQKQNNSYFFGS